MNTTTVEQSADFGRHTLPAIFRLQNEGFERLLKLTELNLAAIKGMLDGGAIPLVIVAIWTTVIHWCGWPAAAIFRARPGVCGAGPTDRFAVLGSRDTGGRGPA